MQSKIVEFLREIGRLRSPRARTIMLVLLIGAVLAVYARSLGNDFVRWDDPSLVMENPIVWSITPDTIRSIFTMYDPKLYIPLTFFSYQIDHLIWGLNPFGYHLTSLLIHIGNVLLVLWLFMLLKRKWWLAFGGALFFAIHPLGTEAVAWVSARKDLLMTFFFLSSLIAYLFYRNGSKKSYWLAIALALCAMLSKPTAIALPFVLLSLNIWRQKGIDRKAITELIPFLALSIIFTIVAFIGMHSDSAPIAAPFLRILILCRAIAGAIWSFFVPIGLTALYPTPLKISLLHWLAVLTIAVGILIAYRARKLLPGFVFGLVFFLLTFFPTLGKSMSPGSMFFTADRYSYLPMVGLIFAVGYVLTLAFSRRSIRPPLQDATFVSACRNTLLRNRDPASADSALYLMQRFMRYLSCQGVWLHRAGVVFLTAIAIVFTYATYTQSLVWKDSETLYEDIMIKEPLAYMAYSNLANAYNLQERYGEAIPLALKSLEIKPRYIAARFNLGFAYLRLGRYQEAIEQFERVELSWPDNSNLYRHLGEAYGKVGRYEEGVVALLKAAELDPEKSVEELLEGIGQ